MGVKRADHHGTSAYYVTKELDLRGRAPQTKGSQQLGWCDGLTSRWVSEKLWTLRMDVNNTP
jgi:hypothetical protein